MKRLLDRLLNCDKHSGHLSLGGLKQIRVRQAIMMSFLIPVNLLLSKFAAFDPTVEVQLYNVLDIKMSNTISVKKIVNRLKVQVNCVNHVDLGLSEPPAHLRLHA